MAKTIEHEHPTPSSPKKTEEKTKPSGLWSKNTVVAGFALIVALLALLIACYTAFSINQNQLKQSEAQISLTKKQQQIDDEQRKMAHALESQAQTMATNQSAAQQQLATFSAQLHTALEQKLYQQQDWLLLKARYYLELAQINTHWSDHYEASIALLQAADTLLSQISEPKVFVIRQAIATEVAQLKAIKVIDFAGILSQLDAAQARVDYLIAQLPANNSSDKTTAKTTDNGWQAHMDQSLKLLQKLVIVRRNSQAIQPLLSQDQEALLKEQIRFNLQQAQWAVLNNHAKLYQLALKQATTNIKRGFNSHTENVSALLKQLELLQQINMDISKPVEGQALTLLNSLIDAKNNPGIALPTSKGEKK